MPLTSFNTAPQPDAATLMQAAILARVHITNMYRLRSKLGAFKRDGVWCVPINSLKSYIQRREARAHAILEPPSLLERADSDVVLPSSPHTEPDVLRC
jgi:hypothetical protein